MSDKSCKKSKFCRQLRERLSLSLALINTIDSSIVENTEETTHNDSNSMTNLQTDSINPVHYSCQINQLSDSSDRQYGNDVDNNPENMHDVELNSDSDLSVDNRHNLEVNSESDLLVQNRHELKVNLESDVLLENIFVKTENNKLEFCTKLRKWAIDDNVPQSTLGNLLQILRAEPVFNYLPKDPRTLLKTPTTTDVENIGSGLFHYFGIFKTLDSIFTKYNPEITLVNDISLAANIDGLPLFKSTASSFWPILCSVKSIPDLKNIVFMVALYYGSTKPPANEFISEFVKECSELSTNGITIKSKKYNFRLSMLICDTPAKSHILSIKGHSGYFSCTKCD